MTSSPCTSPPSPEGTTDAANAWSDRTRLGTILVTHAVNDFYTSLIPPIIGILELRCHMSAAQAPWLLSIGSIVSGVSQPLFAVIADRTGSKFLGTLGLMLTAIGICLVGLATSFWTLIGFYVVGMVGAGMYHPVAAASVGSLSGVRRASGVSAFFVTGMIGAIAGGFLGPRIVTQSNGFEQLKWWMIPGIAIAWALHASAAKPGKGRRAEAGSQHVATPPRVLALVAILYLASAIRFIVNMALVYLYTRWAQSLFSGSSEEVAAQSLRIVGNLSSLTFVGMALGGLAAGTLVRSGTERLWLTFTPLVFSLSIAAFPRCGPPMNYALAVMAGFGFASMVPLSVSMAQHLLPQRTSLASGLMLGGAWTLAWVGPPAAQWGISHFGIPATFGATAVALALSGMIHLPVDFEVARGRT